MSMSMSMSMSMTKTINLAASDAPPALAVRGFGAVAPLPRLREVRTPV
jgi:hypothetical protein